MMDFQPLTREALPLLRKVFQENTSLLCDRTAGGVMMWRKRFCTEYFFDGETLYLRSSFGNDGFSYALPLGNTEKGIERLRDYCAAQGEFLQFSGVTEEEQALLLTFFPDKTATAQRDWFDYIYSTQSLMTFSGKKLSAQRNHRNFFLKNYPDWSFEPITRENLFCAKDYFTAYYKASEKSFLHAEEEAEAVNEIFRHWEDYGFCGGLLFAEGEPIALSLCEIVGNTVYVHIEKANRLYRGAYPMIVSEMLRHFATDEVLYVNREEDEGDVGLRYSKESYCPIRLLKKYTVI